MYVNPVLVGVVGTLFVEAVIIGIIIWWESKK